MIASLPMYDRPETRAANDALWDGVRSTLGYGPATLERTMAYDATCAQPDLLLGQICNLPFRARFRDRLVVIGTGDHQLPDTPPGYYHSVFVVRAEHAHRGLAPATLGTFAYNDALSQSGWGAPLARVNEQGLTFHSTLRTGAHVDSMRAVAEGRADLAAIDALTWRMLQRWEPIAAELAVVGRTGLSPAQSFVTTRGTDPAPLRAALAHAIDTLTPHHADALSLYGLVTLPDSAYDIALPMTQPDPLQSSAN